MSAVINLSDADKQKIADQIQIAKLVQNEISSKEPESVWQKIFSSDNIKWGFTALAIPFTAYITNLLNENNVISRQDVIQVTALIPSLSSDNTYSRKIAFCTLGELRLAEKGRDLAATHLYDAVSLLLQADAENGNPQQKELAAQGKVCLNPDRRDRRGQKSQKAPDLNVQNVQTLDVQKNQNITKISDSVISNNSFVYIQIYDEETRKNAKDLEKKLEQQGVSVAGIENVVTTNPLTALKYPQRGSIDIRYYNAADQSAAASVASFVRSAAGAGVKTTIRDLTGRGSTVKPGSIEIWYPYVGR